jgi:uncharacterized protein (DUF1330 family)
VTFLEGDWRPQMLAIADFPSRAAAETSYRSPEYARALAHRDAALDRNLILVEGAP